MTFASMLVEAVMRERLVVRLLDEDQERHYSEQRHAEADDELRAEARAELEGDHGHRDAQLARSRELTKGVLTADSTVTRQGHVAGGEPGPHVGRFGHHGAATGGGWRAFCGARRTGVPGPPA
jgi:hypothetical protein